jgi:isopentenyl-diphosphate delta-isomerase
MADELVDIVNEQDEVIGTMNKLEAHEKRSLHRLAVILVMHNDTFLVQKRTMAKDGKLAESVGGHVKAGESYEVAAVREAQEEMGLTVRPVFLGRAFGRAKPALADGVSRVSHCYAIFTATIDDAQLRAIQPDAREVECFIPMGLEELVVKMRTAPDLFTGGMIRAINLYIEKKGLKLAPVKISDAI